MANSNALRRSEYVAIVLIALAVAVQAVALYRLVPTLAGMYAGYGLALSTPLQFYILWANRILWIGMVLLAAMIGLKLTGRSMAASTRAALLPTLAIAGACSTAAGLYFIAQDGVMLAIRLSVGAPNQVLERDIATINLAAGNPAAAIALIDPTGDRDFASEVRFGAPGQAFLLAEAYRAEGNIAAARPLYRRSQQAAVMFDEVYTRQLLARHARLEQQFGPKAVEWAPAASTLRQFPELLKSAAQQRLEQLDEQ